MLCCGGSQQWGWYYTTAREGHSLVLEMMLQNTRLL